MKRVIFLMVLILVLVSCSGADKNAYDSITAQNKDENFEIKIYADKGIYSSDEQVVCYATVEYNGEADNMTVYGCDPLVGFAIKGGGFDGEYTTQNVPVTLEFERGIPVTFEFDKSNIARPGLQLDFIEDTFHKQKELYLPSGEYAISATLVYSLEKDDYRSSDHIVSAEVLVKVKKAVKVSEEGTIIFIVIGLAFVTIPFLMMIGQKRKQIQSWRHLNDYDPSREETFEEKLKKARMNPQKVIIFGQNYFAIDNIKKKIFVRSPKTTDGVLLNNKDIVSYEIIKDGIVIGQPGGGFKNITGAAGEDGIICSDLRLVIKTKKASDPEVILPFIAFSIDSEFAYKEALGAAKEAAEALDGIIR